VTEHHCASRKDGAWGMAELVKIKLQDGGYGGISGVPRVRGRAPYAELLEELPGDGTEQV
jgi:hypothetical protein